jgi:hypothetical protein
MRMKSRERERVAVARDVLATVINRKVPSSLANLPLSGPCALVFPQPPHVRKTRLVASP